MNRLLTQFGWRPGALLAVLLLAPTRIQGCIWDSDTLSQERRAHPKLAEAILRGEEAIPDANLLKKRIQSLLGNRREGDASWWNDLAGAHLRLGDPSEAVRLLEPLTDRFKTNYGIRANLGTAYHLLGRYPEAERLISENLKRDPEAHFGLEKYHLALLQHLARDTNYQRLHVYVEEFTAAFLQGGIMAYPTPLLHDSNTNRDSSAVSRAALASQLAQVDGTGRDAVYQRRRLQQAIAELDAPPAYCEHWNLAADPKLEEGIIYMASVNPKQAACFVMLGMRSLQNRDLNLTISAFQRAIQLGSLQSDLLRSRIESLQDHIRTAKRYNTTTFMVALMVVLPTTVGVLLLIRRHRKRSARVDSAA